MQQKRLPAASTEPESPSESARAANLAGARNTILPPVSCDRRFVCLEIRALAKKSDCFKCHTINEKKDGPAWREVAKKYRGKADAEAKLYQHVTTGPIVKIDGEEENHQIVKSKKDPEIYNLIRFILSLP